MTYILLFVSLLCFSLSSAQESSSFLCYVEANCSVGVERPVYSLADSLESCCEKSGVLSALNHTENICFNCAGDAARITPRSVALYPPQSLVLEVAATSYQYITWFINGSISTDISRLTLESNNKRLILSDTVSGDVGEYEADVHLNNGTVVILDFIVQAYVPPNVMINNPTEDDIVRDHVNITCTSQGNPIPTVNLYCENLGTVSTYPNVTVGDFGIIPIASSTIEVESSGADGLRRCHCSVSAYDGSAIYAGNNSILLLPMSPYIKKNDTPVVSVTAPMRSEMRCEAYGRPSPVITWRFEGNIITSEDTRRTINDSMSGYRVDSTLLIASTSSSDHGLYSCIAANVYGNATKLITNLNVRFAPVVTVSSHTYNINVNLYNEVTLTCVSTSNPESRVIWVGEGGVLNDVCAGNSDDFIGAEAGIEYSQIENMFHDFSGDLGVASPSPSAHPRNCTINSGTITQTFLISTSVLTLGSLLHENSMNFVCVGTNDIGDSLSTASISLSLDASPYFSQIPLAIPLLYVGSTVEYNCSVISVTPVNITWLLDGIAIDEEILESKTENETTSTLVLYDIEVGDAGRYTCHAKNDNGTSSRSFVQQIRVPVLSLTTDDNVVREDDSIEMNCTGEGNPLPAITWSYTNEVTGETRNLASPGYTINTVTLPDHDYQVESELILSNATIENAGRYTCTATSPLQDQSTSINVTVLVPAVITEPSSGQTFSPILGVANFSILCAATGVSAPNVSIIRLSSNQSVGTSMKIKQLATGLILSETSLVFDSVTSDARGLYECQASNELAQLKHSFEVSVDDNTIFNTEFQVIDVVIESNLTIPCNITTHASDPVINWYHSGVKLDTDTERFYASSSTSVRDGLTTLVSTLTVSDVEVSDGGNYVCKVVNTYGSYNKTISQVNVQVPPSVSIYLSNLTYIQGINANVSCIGRGSPLPSLQFDGINCSPSSGLPILMHGDRFSGYCQTVGDSVIASLTVSDITELGPLGIECSATNPAGDDTLSETIFITSLSLTTQPENISIPDGGSHTLSCAAVGYPLPDIQWESENDLSLNYDITVDYDGQFEIISNLTIYNYTASNEGEYDCIAKNQYYEPVSSTIVVSTKYIAPSIITRLTNETVAINDNINIICTATGLPPPTVSWKRGDTPTFGNNLLTEVTVNINGTPSVTTSTLVLAGVTLTDEGEYTCIASSSEFSETDETVVKNITITVPPVASIYPSSLVHFIPGQNNSLNCTGTGKPAPTVSISGYQCSYDANTQSEWIINGIIIRCNTQQVGGIYSISMYYTLTESVTDFSPHNVTCLVMSSAFDTVETATSIVQYQVYESVFTQASFATLPEGGTFNISCTSTGYPHPTLDWLYGDDNGAIAYNDRHIRSPDESINAYTVQSILTVKDLVPADAGEYKCRAQYSSGHLVHATSLAVTPFNDCVPNPCVHGSCTDLLRDYTCSCNDDEYTGKNCSMKISDDPDDITRPNITENPANITEAFLFGSFNVTCEAYAGGGFVQYSWLKDSVKLDESSDVLFINEAVPEDRGYYTCVAENFAGNSTSQPGLVVIPGLYQYVAAINTYSPKTTGQSVNLENITTAMGECLSYDVLPDQNTTIIYSVSQCHYAPCATTNGIGSVLITLFQTAPPLQSDNLRDYLFNKLRDLESKCDSLGIQVTDVWRFDGCRRESEVLHRDYGINITWPESEISNDIRRNCPCGRFTESDTYVSGTASRQCRGSYSEGGFWLESDTSQCNYNSKNISITLSLCHLTTVTNVDELVQGLTEQSRAASFFEPLDFTIATLLAEDLAQSERIVSNREVQNGYVEAIENLLLVNSSVVNASQAMHGSGDRLLRSLEIFQERIEIPEVNANSEADTANGTTRAGSISFQRDLIGIVVTKVNTNSFRNQTFSAKLSTREGGGSRRLSEVSLAQGSLEGDSSTASVHIPETLVSKCPPNSSVRINYNVFLSSVIFQGHPLSFFGQLVESGSLNVSSLILSASACRGNSIEGLVEPVILEFPKPAYLLANGTNTSVSTCVFWDQSIRSGSWSMRGCTTISNQNEDVVRCSCDHLTHFGYLFDVEPKETEPGPETTGLEVITYIGIIVSILCLVITIFTFCGAKKLLERTHGKIVINMCLALIGLYIAFLIAGNASSIRSVNGGDEICAVIGALLYYFMLVYFMWTAIDAIDLYRKLVLVFYNKTPWFIIMASIFAWGLPLIIIGISLGAGYDNYLEYQSFCRPSGLPFYIGFLVPFGLVYIFDWAMFILIFVKFCYKKKIHKSREEKAFYINSKQLFFMAMILSINFGLGWGLGLAATAELPRELYLVFAYMFSLFVGMQGFLIFLLHCARSSIARKFWVYLFYIVCLCKKQPEAKIASGHKQALKTPFATPGPRRKFDSHANSMGIPLSSRGSKPGSPNIIQNPVHGFSEEETDFAPARVFDEIDLLQELGPLEIMEQELGREKEPEIAPKKKSVKEKKASKKMSKKESTTKMISKKISKLKLSKKESKKKAKAKESQSLLKTDVSKKLSDSMNSLGDMSLTGSQALEIEFAPSINSSSDEEEEIKWRKLSEQFESINAMVNESFIESKKQKKRKEKASKALEEKDKITEEAAKTEEVEMAEETTEEVEMTEEAGTKEEFEVPEIVVEEAIGESVEVAEIVTNTKEEVESRSKEETISNEEEPQEEEPQEEEVAAETHSRDDNEKEEEDKQEAQEEESDEGASSDEEAALVVTVEREEIEVVTVEREEIEVEIESEERASQTKEGGKREEDESGSEKYKEKLPSSENDQEEDKLIETNF